MTMQNFWIAVIASFLFIIGNLVVADEPASSNWTVIAKQISSRLNEKESLQVSGNLNEMTHQVEDAFGFHVYVDEAALEQAAMQAEDIEIDFRADDLPIRSLLHEMLFPYRLQNTTSPFTAGLVASSTTNRRVCLFAVAKTKNRRGSVRWLRQSVFLYRRGYQKASD